MGVRGVNLGNWLVLEKWMGSSPLAHAHAEDDRTWIDEVPFDDRSRQLDEHYRTFVTEKTFIWLASVGIDLVRIPVPYHLFGSAHHPACVKYLDSAFDWGERYGIGVLVDLHTVPLSQNGFDNGGYMGMCAWARDPARVTATVDLLERIAQRYAGRDALWGIEPLNEPVSWPVFVGNIAKNRRYIRRMPRSRPASRRVVLAFYQRFYDRVRPVVGPDVNLVFHDRFCLESWDRFEPGRGDFHVWIDTHQYVGFADGRLRRHDLASYVALTERMGRRVERAAQYHPVLVGEWSLANHAPSPSDDWYREFALAQLAAWDRGGGSCFWSLRVRGAGRASWSFETCVQRGWM